MSTNPEITPDEIVLGGVRNFIIRTQKATSTTMSPEIAEKITDRITNIDSRYPLFSGRSFSYAVTSSVLPSAPKSTADATALSALRNMEYFINLTGLNNFASRHRHQRSQRFVQWAVPMGEDGEYEVRMRGGSGAGTISVDFALGAIRTDNQFRKYHELWRCGIDTEETREGSVGARFIRTGSAIKPGGSSEFKCESFSMFKKKFGILPQRLLSLTGLYAMREMKPEYAVALSIDGAINYSTLGKSKGICDYDGIFRDVGFRASRDPNWNIIPDFNTGFYTALDRADLRNKEIVALDTVISGFQQPVRIPDSGSHDLQPPLHFKPENSREVIEKEFELHLQ